MRRKNRTIMPCIAGILLLAGCSSAADSMTLAAGTAAAGLAAPQQGGWTQVWFDDFTGNALDRSKWAPEVSCWGGGNNERQCYTDRPANIQVRDGTLRLIARRERFTGPLHPADTPTADTSRATQPYTSGKVRTRGLHAWTYGRFSARMKLPSGLGTWPAFWMMPADSAYGTWPLSGEIDIMEAVNLGAPCAECPGGEEQRTSSALHFGGLYPDNTYRYAKTSGERRPGPADEWRVYSLEWAEGVVQTFVDGELVMRIEASDWHTAAPGAVGRPDAPFDKPFYLILNLAAGGNLPERSPGGGFDPASFPAELLVDWVRVEHCAIDIETGRACLTGADWQGELLGPWEADTG
ncbi:family 16 glycosylhydrolase [Hyphomonas sp.]|uniref:glycoside hydrolase family 16 protein n=1 Tax=Hyphomonas sp. TaxID=87 RepID=UPI00391D80A1